ncbi:MAG: nucleotidyl transferase AbiEii/AbiGii toxin family protein [Saprospirales bacterium]|nr:nucleotidyl transferase AbiEii/AbiGii toxin family protein [Saprospirales bacterium]
MSVMNASPSKEQLEQVAIELAIDPSMVEKDWNVTQVLAFLASKHFPGFDIVFSGGTALSKAHGLIQRFSEDVDFRVITMALKVLSTNNARSFPILRMQLRRHYARQDLR